jgi:HD-like signal output (HDOD) protein
MVIGYLKNIGTGNMDKYILAAIGVSLVIGTWFIQDWRYNSKIAKIEMAHTEEKIAIANEANLQLVAQLELNKKLSQELIDTKSKNSKIESKNKGNIDEFTKNNPASYKFSADWVRLYNNSLSNTAE